MPEAACLAALCRQASGLSGNHVAVGRKPGGSDAGDQLAEEVCALFEASGLSYPSFRLTIA